MAVCKDFPCKQQITHDCDDRTAAESIVHGSAVRSISFVYISSNTHNSITEA